MYPSASLWLTDYLISTTLATAYQARVDAAAQAQAQLAADAAPLTPQVKDLIAAEVQRQLAIENAESAQQAAGPNPAVSGVQRMLSDNQSHVFVAGKEVDVVDATGTECAISEGDVLQLTPTPLPDDATAATLVVMTTKGGVECKKGAAVTVEIADLQDMQNHMRESIGQGMGDLKAKQGKGGLPALPASASGDADDGPVRHGCSSSRRHCMPSRLQRRLRTPTRRNKKFSLRLVRAMWRVGLPPLRLRRRLP